MQVRDYIDLVQSNVIYSTPTKVCIGLQQCIKLINIYLHITFLTLGFKMATSIVVLMTFLNGRQEYFAIWNEVSNAR